MFFKLYLIALPLLILLDLLWIGVLAKDLYKSQIGFLMKASVNWVGVALFYLIFIAGLVVFAILPSVEKSSLAHAILMGGFFGLVTYATFDLTNLAILKDWPVLITLVDLLWGSVLGALVSGGTFYIARYFFFAQS